MDKILVTTLTEKELRDLIREELSELINQINTKQQPAIDVWFTVVGLCNYLPDKPKKATVYGWVSNRLIPHHKSGRKLRFLKSDIDKWLTEGRRKTKDEIKKSV